MAKVVAPLLGWSASGQIAKTQVYAEWKGRPYARRYVIPANPNTAGQQLTRNTFKFLNALWQFLPAASIAAWGLYATVSRFTPRNGWLKQNNGPLRTQTDLLLLTASTAAGSGLVAASMVLVATSGGITATLVPPTLPVGWSIVSAHAMAIRDVNPQTSEIYDVGSAADVSAPYDCIITGLTNPNLYVVGGWFEYTKANGQPAFGVSLSDTETPLV